MLEVILPTFKPVLQKNQVSARCEKLFQEERILLQNKYSHVTPFTSPRQTCFAASDVTLHQCTA